MFGVKMLVLTSANTVKVNSKIKITTNDYLYANAALISSELGSKMLFGLLITFLRDPHRPTQVGVHRHAN